MNENSPRRGNLISKLLGRTPPSDNPLEAVSSDTHKAGNGLRRERMEMIERVIAFDSKRVDDVMAPRADITAVELNTELDELIKCFAEAGHSRMPIFRGDLDDPVGMVHIKDVVQRIADPQPTALPQSGDPILQQIKREVLYVPPSMRITDLLLRMQASRIHMALVIDEFGGTDGLVTIEDLVEEIVGEINDEHDDDDEALLKACPDGGWDVDARLELEEFAEETGVVLKAEEDEVDTLGGLIFSLAGRVPQRGEVLSDNSGYEFEVTDADPRKIRKIRIRPKKRKGKRTVVATAPPADINHNTNTAPPTSTPPSSAPQQQSPTKAAE